MGRLKGKVAIITGGASGLGQAFTRIFVQEGAKVVFTDIKKEEGYSLEDALKPNALFVEHDVSDSAQWKNVIKHAETYFGPVSILVNNAGIGGREEALADYSEDNYHRVIAVNQTGTFLGMKHVVSSMKKSGGGSIINISSIAGIFGAMMKVAYSASKFAVRGMTKVAAGELAQYNIRANSVHPSLIETPVIKQKIKDDLATAELAGRMYAKNPLKRGGEPDEVAQLLVFLASDESSFVNGAEIMIDGGVSAVEQY